MTVRRATGPVGDPFWDTFLARHPGVDVVLLPQPAPGPPPGDDPVAGPYDATALGTLRDLVDGAARHVAAAALSVPTAPTDPDDAVMSGPAAGSVRARSAVVLPGRAEEEVDLTRAASALGTRWSVEVHDGLVGRLVARGRVRVGGVGGVGGEVGVELLASWAPTTGVLQVEATSAPVDVGTTRAEELLAARRTRRTGGGSGAEADR